MKKSLVLLSALVLALFAVVQADTDKEIERKAEFIVSLVDNIEWPEDAKPGEDEEILIYVVGDCPELTKLAELAEKHAEEGAKVKVEAVSPDDDLSASRILYLPTDDFSVLAKVLKKISGSKIVTVADADEFARFGAMIAFRQDQKDSKLHYEVNKLVVDSVGISLSSKILKDADLI